MCGGYSVKLPGTNFIIRHMMSISGIKELMVDSDSMKIRKVNLVEYMNVAWRMLRTPEECVSKYLMWYDGQACHKGEAEGKWVFFDCSKEEAQSYAVMHGFEFEEVHRPTHGQ
jgi:hypothetical protein